jgi:FG-GAP repeat
VHKVGRSILQKKGVVVSNGFSRSLSAVLVTAAVSMSACGGGDRPPPTGRVVRALSADVEAIVELDLDWSGDVALSEFEDTALLGDAVFVKDAMGWAQQQILTCASGGASRALGTDTAIVGDCVFVRVGDVWELETTLAPDTPVPSGEFGKAVALSGETVIVGAPGESAVYVFVRAARGWIQQAKLVPDDPTLSFGRAVDVDGDTALIGADDSAYVFERQGGAWQQSVRLTLSGEILKGEALLSLFGARVALSTDVALVGVGGMPAVEGRRAGTMSTSNVDGPLDGEGSYDGAIVFERTTDGWQEREWLSAPGSFQANGSYAFAVDRRLAFVGANWFGGQCAGWFPTGFPINEVDGKRIGAAALEGHAFVFTHNPNSNLGGIPGPQTAYVVSLQGRLGDACTIDADCGVGVCSDGICAIQVCDDDNPCTADSCRLAKPCLFEPVEDRTPCPDGYCSAGACVVEPPSGGGGATPGYPAAGFEPSSGGCGCAAVGTLPRRRPRWPWLVVLGLPLVVARRRS